MALSKKNNLSEKINRINTISLNNLRAGNYHHSEYMSHARCGWWSATIDGKAFAQITAHGIEMVKAASLKFEPIRITFDWLIGFGCIYMGRALNQDSIWAHKALKESFSLSERGIEFEDSKQVIQYVHGFQNFFHESTGAEVELNLNLIKQYAELSTKK